MLRSNKRTLQILKLRNWAEYEGEEVNILSIILYIMFWEHYAIIFIWTDNGTVYVFWKIFFIDTIYIINI